jgi:hypothetical protein
MRGDDLVTEFMLALCCIPYAHEGYGGGSPRLYPSDRTTTTHCRVVHGLCLGQAYVGFKTTPYSRREGYI